MVNSALVKFELSSRSFPFGRSATSGLKGSDLGVWANQIGSAKSSLLFYRGVRRTVRATLLPYLRVECERVKTLDIEGPIILAPVHRSHLDSVVVAALTSHSIRALAKESLFTTPGLGRLVATMGAIPVRRGEADIAAMKSAKKLLDDGAAMIVFPEGSRNSGDEVGPMFDGVAWLAARTGAQVIPIGVSGTEEAMTEGSRGIKRGHVGVYVGDPLPAPVGPEGKRAKREQLSGFTMKLRDELQAAQDQAIAISQRSKQPDSATKS